MKSMFEPERNESWSFDIIDVYLILRQTKCFQRAKEGVGSERMS